MTSSSIKCVYVLHGSDAFLCDTHRQELLARLVGDADPQTCVASYDATAELARVLDDLRTLPFLAPRRVVIVRDADAFVATHRQALEAYLDAPVETASLVLMVSSWPKNTRLHKRVEAVGETIDCAPPKDSNAGAWLKEAVARRHKRIAPDATELLIQWVGPDRALIEAETEKLALYAGSRETITLADVSALVTSTAGPTPFALADALTAGDAAAALTALGQMLTVRGDEFRALGLIAWHLRRVVRVQQMLAAGKSADAAMRIVRVPNSRGQFTELLKRRPIAKLIGDFRRILAADRAMKTGAAPQAALQQLVVGLCA